MDLNTALSIQSSSFNDVATLDGLVERVRALGVRRIELAPRHLPLGLAQIELKEALVTLACGGVAASAWGVFPMGRDPRDDRRLLLHAQFAGMATVVADPEPDRIEAVAALAAEYGVKIAIHNQGPEHRWGTTAALEEVLEGANAWVGACLDVGHLLQAGDDPLAALDALRGRVFGVHLKDVARLPDGAWGPCSLGKGVLALRPLLERLGGEGFNGVLSLEHDAVRGDPMPGIKESLAAYAAAVTSLAL